MLLFTLFHYLKWVVCLQRQANWWWEGGGGLVDIYILEAISQSESPNS